MAYDRRTFLRMGTGLAAMAATAAPRIGAAANRIDTATVKTGGVRMVPVDGKYNVWTKRVGFSSTRMLTLHGGPGCTHEYLECFDDFLPQQGIEYYYYDQLGSAYSDQPKDASLWTLDRFREEVEQVRAALGLKNFYLYGHSWGGMLAIEYALQYPQQLKGLIISDMTASIDSYLAYINQLRKQLPPEVIATLEKYEAKNDFDAPEYQQAMFSEVYTRHLCRLDPWPEPLQRTFRNMNQQVYNTMQGANEFQVTGNLRSWNRWDDLKRIEVPTLLLVGRHDEMNPDDIVKMGQLMPKSRVHILENGSHMCMYDDQQMYFRHLTAFVRDVQAKRFST
ncbi:MAG TPA: proline iminopeptidase-family hydrolase [Nevskiaceae bacterium]|nr:proline iminopeptidase-family hydrolase [Nevskiaceae bacterium]